MIIRCHGVARVRNYWSCLINAYSSKSNLPMSSQNMVTKMFDCSYGEFFKTSLDCATRSHFFKEQLIKYPTFSSCSACLREKKSLVYTQHLKCCRLAKCSLVGLATRRVVSDSSKTPLIFPWAPITKLSTFK